jgi:hypothetical protein
VDEKPKYMEYSFLIMELQYNGEKQENKSQSKQFHHPIEK